MNIKSQYELKSGESKSSRILYVHDRHFSDSAQCLVDALGISGASEESASAIFDNLRRHGLADYLPVLGRRLEKIAIHDLEQAIKVAKIVAGVYQ